MAASGVGLFSILGANLASPATAAATRHDFAFGGGTHGRMWVDAESTQEGGTCTAVVDAFAAQNAPQTNQLDGVILTPAATGMDGTRTLHVSWGATQMAPLGSQLLLRFTREIGCSGENHAFGPGGGTVAVPAWAKYIVITATEGTIQPWVTL
jgi:hypothetical protein